METAAKASSLQPASSNMDSIGFVRNVNIAGEWKQLTISTEEQAHIINNVCRLHAFALGECMARARETLNSEIKRPTNRMVLDAAIAMMQRTAPHIHLAFSHYLEKKAKAEREMKVE